MDVEAIERVLKLIVDMKLESNTLMWVAVTYFATTFLKSVIGYVVLGVVGVYFVKTLKWAMTSAIKEHKDSKNDE